MNRHIYACLLMIFFSAIANSCMAIKPADSMISARQILSEGELPLASESGISETIANSKVPVIVIFTAKWCQVCKSVVPDFWREVRYHQDEYIGLVVDIEENPQLYNKLLSPAIPAIVVFENKAEKWRAIGASASRKIVNQLKTNKVGYTMPLATRKNQTGENFSKKVFLVAAGSDIANFSQEVSDQFDFWLSKGLREDEIGCYVSLPDYGSYREDRDQFDALKSFLSKCQRAVLSDIEMGIRTAVSKEPDWLFIYMTSHGSKALDTDRIEEFKKVGARVNRGSCRDVLGPHMVFDSDVLGDFRLIDNYIERSCLSNLPDNFEVMSKRRFESLLNSIPSSIHAAIVLQSCFSGDLAPKVLSESKVLITASDIGKTSFGCAPSDRSTFFGEKFLEAVKSIDPRPMTKEVWTRIYESAKKGVTNLEEKNGIEPNNRSNPRMFFSAGY